MMNKKVSLIGVGKLGLCLGLNLEKNGIEVIGIDVSKDYVDSLTNKTFESDEAGVNELLAKSQNFKFSTDIKDALVNDLIFLVVATPSSPDGNYDHYQVDRVVDGLIKLGKNDNTKHLVICCTTSPKYSDTVQEKLKDFNWNVSYNPEFIAQGTILHDQEYPDMVLIGQSDQRVANEIIEVYQQIIKSDPRYCVMGRTEAEITKIALNCFLTTKIAYANMVGDVAIAAGCRPTKILRAIGEDSRIGRKYLGYGFGFGGPCFPRDNVAFGNFAEKVGVEPFISRATDLSNAHHLEQQLKQIKAEPKMVDTNIVFETVSYKPASTMLVESQQLKLAISLADNGYSVVIKERQSVIEELKKTYGDKFIYEPLGVTEDNGVDKTIRF